MVLPWDGAPRETPRRDPSDVSATGRVLGKLRSGRGPRLPGRTSAALSRREQTGLVCVRAAGQTSGGPE